MIRQGFIVGWDMDLEGALAFAADRGFDFVELNMNFKEYERQDVDPDHVRRAADERGISLAVHLPYRLDPGSPHEHVRDGACRELEAAIDAAADMGAETGVFHAMSGVSVGRWETEVIREYIYDSIDRIDAYARERGVVACAENVMSPFFDVDDFPDLFEHTDGTGCLDTGHAYITGRDGAMQADLIREVGDRISHIHLNDTRRDDSDEHLPVGFGTVDFGPLAAAMRETGWTGTCTHEVFSFDERYAGYGKETFDTLLEETEIR